jgi:hypothetical protein
MNSILHTFGWAIVVSFNEDGEINEAYPARCKFRGFTEEINDSGYEKIGKYLKDNGKEIYNEINDEEEV